MRMLDVVCAVAQGLDGRASELTFTPERIWHPGDAPAPIPLTVSVGAAGWKAGTKLEPSAGWLKLELWRALGVRLGDDLELLSVSA